MPVPYDWAVGMNLEAAHAFRMAICHSEGEAQQVFSGGEVCLKQKKTLQAGGGIGCVCMGPRDVNRRFLFETGKRPADFVMPEHLHEPHKNSRGL